MSSGLVSIEQAYAIALAHHQAGQLAPAEAIYRQILAVDPGQPDTLHLLGLIEHQQGHHEQGLELIRRSLEIHPENPPALSNLGEVYKALRQWKEAQACYERALAFEPNLADAHNNLGTAHLYFGRFEEARRSFERAAALQPDNGQAQHNLGLACDRLRLQDQASIHFERAAKLRPNHPETHLGFGCALFAQDRMDEARAQFERALALRPDYPEAAEAMAGVMIETLRFSEAASWARRGLALAPNNAGAHARLAGSLQEIGELDAALASYRRAVALPPYEMGIHSNLIRCLHCHPTTTAADIRAECERWNERHAAPLRPLLRPHANDPDPARCLKVGYVSPDFRDHAVSHFIEPLLAAHDHTRFEIHAYASGRRTDEVTARLRPLTDQWHEAGHATDETLAAQIQADGIDILVDLTVHSGDHRLLTLARRPAPVQVSWLGYAGTTGMEAVDYRFTDAHMDPSDFLEGAMWSAEEPVLLPDSWCCYQPAPDAPAVGELPALGTAAAGTVTFGSLNQGSKHHRATLGLWGRVLAEVPNSRLLLYNPDPEGRRLMRGTFEAAGIAGTRILFVERQSKLDCLRIYNQVIDVALDPFPHNGMTTTCEALWMGVPVVTMPGVLPVSRTGLSLLSTVGLPELIARDEDDYVRVAADLARDLPRLAALRAGLRARLQNSPLMDAPRFARNVESAYRSMWQRWCATRGLPGGTPPGSVA